MGLKDWIWETQSKEKGKDLVQKKKTKPKQLAKFCMKQKFGQ